MQCMTLPTLGSYADSYTLEKRVEHVPRSCSRHALDGGVHLLSEALQHCSIVTMAGSEASWH
eukprot:4102795-Amphidinium_carterae.1